MEFSRFRDEKARFDALGAEVVGISVDPPKTNLAWSRDLGLPFRLLSDLGPKGKVGRRYGVYDEAWGLERRATFIIDRDRIIRFVEVDGLALDIQPVLTALDRLAKAAR
ncbi:MAG: redoxin domain-containing protein [Candidatus Rokubacteria bacterium]|nr:redoxin domain-containing protein [Candidatus Rokubacteria bacterium]